MRSLDPCLINACCTDKRELEGFLGKGNKYPEGRPCCLTSKQDFGIGLGLGFDP